MKVNILNVLKFVKKNVHYLIVASIILGLLNVYFLGGWAIPKIMLVSVVMFLVIFPVMVNLKIEELIKHAREPKILFYSLLINFTISPLIAFIIGKIFFAEHPLLFVAIMLLSFIPTSSMTAAWTDITGGNLATAMYLIPANLLFSAFIAVPFILPRIIGNLIEVNSWTFVRSILLVFFIPLLLGLITRKIIVKYAGDEKYKTKIKPELGGVSSLGIIILVFLVMSLKRTTLLFSNHSLIFVIAVPLLIYYGAMFLISTGYIKLLVSRSIFQRTEAIVISYASSIRHLNITLAIILVTFSVEQATLMVLFIVLGFIVQLPSLGFYAQHFGRRFVKGKTVHESVSNSFKRKE